MSSINNTLNSTNSLFNNTNNNLNGTYDNLNNPNGTLNSNGTFNSTNHTFNNTNSGWSVPNFSEWVPDYQNWRMPTSEECSAGFEKTAITLLLHVVPIALSALVIVKTAKLVYTDLSQRTIQHGEKSAHGLTSGQKLVAVVFGTIVTTLATAFICERADAFKAFHFTATPA